MWASGVARGEGWTADLVDTLSRAFGIDLDTPWEKLPKQQRDVIMYGSGGREVSMKWGDARWKMEWEGLTT